MIPECTHFGESIEFIYLLLKNSATMKLKLRVLDVAN